MAQRPRRELVATAIRAAMTRQSMTDAALADASGIPAADLGILLSGGVALDVDQLEAIGAALGVPIRSLLGEPQDG